MTLFPDICALAEAEEEDVLKAWEGLGYYSRARNIHKGAAYLLEKHNGALPSRYEELLAVPGIGDYTARALLSLAFGLPWPVLDANVRRIGQRLTAREEWGRDEDRQLLDSLGRIIPPEDPGRFNAALMQLGQQVCRTGRPSCASCPFLKDCLARKQGLEELIPQKKKRVIREKHTTLFLIIHRGRVLMVRRSRGIGQGLWFLPGVESASAGPLRKKLSSFLDEAGSLPGITHFYTCWKDYLNTEIYETPSPGRLEIPDFKNNPEDSFEWVKIQDLESRPSPSVYRRILGNFQKGLAEF